MFKGKWPNYKLLKIREIPLQQLRFFFSKKCTHPKTSHVGLYFIWTSGRQVYSPSIKQVTSVPRLVGYMAYQLETFCLTN